MRIDKELLLELNGEKGRIDKVLADIFQEESRSTIQKLIQEGHILVEGQAIRSNYKTIGHEKINIVPFKEDVLPLVAQKVEFEIVYEDDDILVINKPRGLVVHPAKNHPDHTLINGLIYYLGNHLSHMEDDTLRPGIVHRIDKDTSGLMVVAKNNYSHQYLSNQLIDHSMHRAYYALAAGIFSSEEGTIKAPIKRDPNNRMKYSVQKDGKEAITHFKVIEQFQECALLECQLETGRTHQIRVHLDFIHHSIIGDPIYGKTPTALESLVKNIGEGQFLHAYQLTLHHPKSRQSMTFTSALPEYFAKFLDIIKTQS